ncbi:MAG: S24 family peptidase [Bacillota bacterium]
MSKKTFGKWLREKRVKAGYESQGALSRACGIDHSTVARWERGDVKPMPENLKKLAPFLGVSFEELMAAVGYISDTGKRDTANDYTMARKTAEQPDFYLKEKTGKPYKTVDRMIRIPLVATIRPGMTHIDQAAGHIEIPSGIQADFAVRVAGNSMYQAGIAEGDIAICRDATAAGVRSGQIVAASLKEDQWQATIKFYIERDGQRFLRTANPLNKDMPLNDDKHRVAGVVVKFLKEPPTLDDYKKLHVASGESPEWASLVAQTTNAGLTPADLAQYVEAVRKASLKARK